MCLSRKWLLYLLSFSELLQVTNSHLSAVQYCTLFSALGYYLVAKLSTLLQGTQTVFVERKGSIIIHSSPWSVLVILVGREGPKPGSLNAMLKR